MKVLLLAPPYFGLPMVSTGSRLPYLGLLYIGSALRSRGFDVDFLDLETEGLNPNQFDSHTAWSDACLQQITRRSPFDLIGLGPILASTWTISVRICKIVKKAFPKKLLVVGGPQISTNSPTFARTFLQISQADLAVIGDGEWTLSDIAAKIKGKEDPSQVSGVVSHSSHFERRRLIDNLDLFPPPARDFAMYSHRQYKLAKRRQFEVVNRISVPQYQDLPTATMMTSRGCVYSCAFCGTERGRRVHSVDRVLDELEMCVKLGFHYFVFFDDLFIGPSKDEMDRSASICQGILNRNMQIFWEIEERADILARLSSEYIQLMFDAGLRIINIGFEKPTNESLKIMKKGQRIEDAPVAVDKLRKIRQISKDEKIIINGNFILGGRDETENDCLKTIDFAQSLGIDHATFNILEIYPGAPLWNQLNRITTSNSLMNFDTTQYYPSELLPVDKLLQLQHDAYQSFYASDPEMLKMHDTAKHL